MTYDDNNYRLIRSDEAEPAEGTVRAFQLEDGVVMQVYDLLLEFEDKLFYEVEEARGIVNPYHKRTGKIFTMEQLNTMFG